MIEQSLTFFLYNGNDFNFKACFIIIFKGILTLPLSFEFIDLDKYQNLSNNVFPTKKYPKINSFHRFLTETITDILMWKIL